MEQEKSILSNSVNDFLPHREVGRNLLSKKSSGSKKCPKCGSVFCTENECEGCGFQFQYDPLGAPFGDKSFYAFQDEFWASSINRIVNSSSILNSYKIDEYKRVLLKRCETLISYFYKLDLDLAELKKDIFWIELCDIVEEMAFVGVSDEDIWGQHHLTSIRSDLFEVINKILSVERNKFKEKGFKSFFEPGTQNNLRALFWGRIALYALCSLFFSYVLVVTAPSF